MPQNILLWEYPDSDTNDVSACIVSNDAAFQAAHRILLSYLAAIPSEDAREELKRDYDRHSENRFSLEGVRHIAMQLGGTKSPCGGDLCSVYGTTPSLQTLINDFISCFGVNPLSAIDYRNKPDDVCQVQVSTDNGTTWDDAWRMDGCIDTTVTTITNQNNSSKTTVNQSNNLFNQAYSHYTTNYTSSMNDIYPQNMPNIPNSSYIDNALCHALAHLVNAVSDASIDYFDQRDAQQQTLNLGLAITAAFLAIIAVAGAIPTGGFSLSLLAADATIFGAGVATAGAIGNALYDKWQSESKVPYQNQTARNDVICYLYDHLKDTDVTQTAFASVLNAFTGSSDAQVIAGTVDLSISIPQTYAAFAKLWGDSTNFALANTQLYTDCPCDQGTACDSFALGFGIYTHQIDATHAFSHWDGCTQTNFGTTGGAWNATCGEFGDGGILGVQACSSPVIQQASVLVDFGSEKVVTSIAVRAGFFGTATGSTSMVYIWYDDTGAYITGVAVSSSNDPGWRDGFWDGVVSGARYLAINAVGSGTQAILDSICVGFT